MPSLQEALSQIASELACDDEQSTPIHNVTTKEPIMNSNQTSFFTYPPKPVLSERGAIGRLVFEVVRMNPDHTSKDISDKMQEHYGTVGSSVRSIISQFVAGGTFTRNEGGRIRANYTRYQTYSNKKKYAKKSAPVGVGPLKNVVKPVDTNVVERKMLVIPLTADDVLAKITVAEAVKLYKKLGELFTQ